MHKTLRIPVFLKTKHKKKSVNYSIFCRLIAKNARIYTDFGTSRKRGRLETLYIAVFWPLLGAETLVFKLFLARDSTKPL